MNKIAIIDADGLAYHSLRETIEESLLVLNKKIQNIFEKTEATYYVMFISQGKYFRHNIFPEYKKSREKYRGNAKWIKTLKAYLIENWNAQNMNLVEADDLCTYFMNKDICINTHSSENPYFNTREGWESVNCILSETNDTPVKYESVEKVLCSPDKDLLLSIPGKHYNYSYKLEDKDDPNSIIKGWWIETNKDEAIVSFWKSVIYGDQTDGVKGIEGKGKLY
jgi:5'-3' exonuclease